MQESKQEVTKSISHVKNVQSVFSPLTPDFNLLVISIKYLVTNTKYFLRELNHMEVFSHFFYKGANFCDFLYTFHHTEMLRKGSYTKMGQILGRASISKRTPFIYLAFEKTDPFIYLIIQNVDLFIYCPLIFCTHFLLVVREISQSIHVIPRG